MRSFRSSLGAALAALILATACGGSQTAAPAPSGKPHGSVTFGLGGIPTDLGPYAAVAPPGLYVYKAVYDGLVTLDEKANVVPALATSWKADSPTSWTFNLRQNVVFQNGEALDADGVAADFKYLLGHASLPAAAQAVTVASVKAVDAKTVQVVTKDPDPLLTRRLTAVPIPAPKAYAADPASFATKAIGTGAFQLTDFTVHQSLTLKAWDKSWRPAPKLAQVTFKEIPDAATRVQALKAGQIDVAQGVSPDDISGLKAASFQIEIVPRAQIQQVTFETVSQGGPLANQDVRLAMNYAVDTQKIVSTILQGTTKPASGQIVGSDGFGFNPAIKPYGFDPAKAKTLLAKAGFPNGFSTTAEITVGNFPNDKQAYEAVANYLDQVGIKVTLKVVTLAEFLKAFRGGPRDPLFVEGLQYLPEIDASKAFSWYSCAQPQAARRFCDQQLEDLLVKANTELNESKRKDLLLQAGVRFHDLAPAIPLWQLTDIWGVRKGLSGWVIRSDAELPLGTLTG